MTQNPIISIIVPIYKTERYLSKCLNSLINQTFRDIEIICIVSIDPNHLNDQSMNICKSFSLKDNRISIIIQQPKGLSAARNEGLLHANGKYIQFCDSDDYYSLRMCEKIVYVMEKYDVDLTVSNVKPVSIKQFNFPARNLYFKVPFEGKHEINIETFQLLNVFVWNKIFKNSIIKQYNITFPVGLYCEDACFLYKYLMVSHTIYYLKNNLYFYLQYRKNSLMLNSSIPNASRALDHVNIMENIYKFMGKWDLEDKFSNIFLKLLFTYITLATKYNNMIYNEIFKISTNIVKMMKYEYLSIKIFNNIDILVLKSLQQNNIWLFNWAMNQKKAIEKSNINKKYLALSLILFPYYIYQIYIKVYNKPCFNNHLGVIFKAYLFFPYFVLKTFLTLISREKLCNL